MDAISPVRYCNYLEIIYNKWQKAIIDHYRKGKAAMPKRKYGFNTVYISERLQESLRPISHCALSTIIAPMGYGKTTAADWYLEKKKMTERRSFA